MKFQTNDEIRVEQRPQELRRNSTDAERKLWQALRGRQIAGAKFRRQHAVANYIVDFVSFDVMVVIELDGGQHADQIAYDEVRTVALRASGFRVLRYWNNQVMAEMDSVLEDIHRVVSERTQTPSPP